MNTNGRKFIQTEEGLKAYCAALLEMPMPEYGIVIERTTGKRTTRQNSALHVYCKEVAETLNDAGLDMRRTLKADVDIPWTLNSVKEYMWRPVMTAMTGKTSTRDLEKVEISKIYETMSRHLASNHAIMVEFPDRRER